MLTCAHFRLSPPQDECRPHKWRIDGVAAAAAAREKAAGAGKGASGLAASADALLAGMVGGGGGDSDDGGGAVGDPAGGLTPREGGSRPGTSGAGARGGHGHDGLPPRAILQVPVFVGSDRSALVCEVPLDASLKGGGGGRGKEDEARRLWALRNPAIILLAEHE